MFGKRRSRRVADEALEGGPILGLDAHSCVERKALEEGGIRLGAAQSAPSGERIRPTAGRARGSPCDLRHHHARGSTPGSSRGPASTARALSLGLGLHRAVNPATVEEECVWRVCRGIAEAEIRPETCHHHLGTLLGLPLHDEERIKLAYAGAVAAAPQDLVNRMLADVTVVPSAENDSVYLSERGDPVHRFDCYAVAAAYTERRLELDALVTHFSSAGTFLGRYYLLLVRVARLHAAHLSGRTPQAEQLLAIIDDISRLDGGTSERVIEALGTVRAHLPSMFRTCASVYKAAGGAGSAIEPIVELFAKSTLNTQHWGFGLVVSDYGSERELLRAFAEFPEYHSHLERLVDDHAKRIRDDTFPTQERSLHLLQCSELPRIFRRLQLLRGCSHGKTEQVFAGGPQPGRPAGQRAGGGPRHGVGGHPVGSEEDWVHTADPAEVGQAGAARRGRATRDDHLGA